jgi:hypothetical protein
MEEIPRSQNLSYGGGTCRPYHRRVALSYLVANWVEEVIPCTVYRVRIGPMVADHIVASGSGALTWQLKGMIPLG